MEMQTGASADEVRQQAIANLRKKREFKTHVVIYVLVNAMLVAIWAIASGTDTLFWPIFPILGWGVGLAANAWDVYGRRPITEDEVAREAARLRGEPEVRE